VTHQRPKATSQNLAAFATPAVAARQWRLRLRIEAEVLAGSASAARRRIAGREPAAT
jgi:hypothetical protein